MKKIIHIASKQVFGYCNLRTLMKRCLALVMISRKQKGQVDVYLA